MIKKIIACAMAVLMFNLTTFAAAPLTRGTSFSVRFSSSVTSNPKAETTPSAFVDHDVKNANGTIVIKKGTPVELVVNKTKAKGCGKPGTLEIQCVSTTAVDGQRISLNGDIAKEGTNQKGLSIGLGVGLGVTFLPFVGFAFLAIKGHDAKIESNTIIPNVFVMNDYTIAE